MDNIEIILNNTKHWNGGAGLIVNPHAAKILRKLGYKKNYTVSKMVKDVTPIEPIEQGGKKE